jgi:uncharacterized protein (TIGR01777 family)
LKVAIIGGTGFIGSNLTKNFNNPMIISSKNFNDIEKIKNYDVVINLAGKPIVKRWSESYKKELFTSRIDVTKKIVEIINDSNVQHFISTSAIGFYKNPCICDENSKSGDGFLSKLAIAWENEALKCNKPTTIFRYGVVLGDNGGALKEMLFPFKMGIGGVIGNGKQKFSWIDIKDVINIYKFVIENQIEGILNISSPNSVTNYEFTKTLGKVLNRITILPMPKFFLNLIFGEASTVLLADQDMKPKRLVELGYNFKYKYLEDSLRSLV